LLFTGLRGGAATGAGAFCFARDVRPVVGSGSSFTSSAAGALRGLPRPLLATTGSSTCATTGACVLLFALPLLFGALLVVVSLSVIDGGAAPAVAVAVAFLVLFAAASASSSSSSSSTGGAARFALRVAAALAAGVMILVVVIVSVLSAALAALARVMRFGGVEGAAVGMISSFGTVLEVIATSVDLKRVWLCKVK